MNINCLTVCIRVVPIGSVDKGGGSQTANPIFYLPRTAFALYDHGICNCTNIISRLTIFFFHHQIINCVNIMRCFKTLDGFQNGIISKLNFYLYYGEQIKKGLNSISLKNRQASAIAYNIFKRHSFQSFACLARRIQ